MNIKQSEFINSDGSVVLIGIPGGGKSTAIVKYIDNKCNSKIIGINNVLIFTFNKNAQRDLSEKIKGINYKQKVQTFDSFHLQFNKANKINIDKTNKTFNERCDLNQIKCLENIVLSETNINFIIKIKMIIVDESQDMNEKHYKLIKIISERLNIPVIMVGDPNQCIYMGLKNSNSKYMLQFSDNIIRLNINYRSTPQIINLAKHFQNDINEIEPINKDGPLPMYIKSRSKKMLFNHILNKIIKLKTSSNILLSEICIITYINQDGIDINNLLNSNCFTTNNLNSDSVKIQDDAINIMTYYKSKGLEFRVVFLFDFQDWYYIKDVELDNNLKYVGITRAKEQLYMYYNTYNEKFNKHNKENYIMENLPRGLCDSVTI